MKNRREWLLIFTQMQMLGFMVFSLVWVGEIFCIVRVRGSRASCVCVCV